MNASGLALIVEDHAEVSRWISGLLQQVFPELELHTAADLKTARQLLATHPVYELALVDLGLPDGSGIELIREMSARQQARQIIVTTVHDDDKNVFGALAAGAQGYLLKEQEDDLILLHLRHLQAGQPPLSPGIARRMLQYFRDKPADDHDSRNAYPGSSDRADLTPRETEVLAGIGRGQRVSEVARQLGLADSTVASYIKSIYFKLNISSRAEAALEAARRGLA